MKTILTLLISLNLSLVSCQTKKPNAKQDAIINAKAIEVPLQNDLAKAYFASGCFWCVEAVYESVNGVTEVINGYAGGYTENPTYQLSNTGRTGHAEAVEVLYDPTIVSFSTLLEVYFGSQDVTQIDGQGPDNGSQYRSIIFYQNQDQKDEIINKIKQLTKELNVNIAAEVYPFLKFWKGEDYHQNYERLHPNNSYIRNISIPRLRKFKQKFKHLLK
ncbi:MAG: peptide-methionine (S)-S-oxide reductase MsrA [Flavobacteriales bacterium]|tara:strand:+ start:292 stop:942 length:651 start_codon:yes stop_codon:yes gene_type:complete